MGGGTVAMLRLRNIAYGLSPRGRGNPRKRPFDLPKLRSIPAWAGEPLVENRSTKSKAVYPRVGGGTHRERLGVYLRPGLSPRGRGNLESIEGGVAPIGSIPAWAGEPSSMSEPSAMYSVYPRVGGGTRLDTLTSNPL